MDDEKRTYDIGDNAEELGLAFLFVRYVLPIVLAIGLVIGGFLFLRWFLIFAIHNPQTYGFRIR